MPKDDFASLMERSLSDVNERSSRRLRKGDTIEGTVIQVGIDTIFLDIGAAADAQISRAELEDGQGEVRVRVGDRLRATVVDPRPDRPKLAISMGRGTELGLDQLRLALETKTPVVGRVTQSIKGGVEVDIGGQRTFCPASQLDLSRVGDLAEFVGQTLEFLVLEVRERGAVVSRRALLERQRQEQQATLLDKLVPGAEVEATVHSTNRHGAVVDLEGIEGFVPISELALHRIERVEDAVSVGDRVKARVLTVQRTNKGLSIRLSLRGQSEAKAASKSELDEVLLATVSGSAPGGIFVETPKGQGLVPVQELELAPGADHRRAYPVGKQFKVVLLRRDPNGKAAYSARGVAAVEERVNYREFASGASPSSGSGKLGSLGDLLRAKFGEALPSAAPEPAPAAERSRRVQPERAAKPASEPARGEPMRETNTAPMTQPEPPRRERSHPTDPPGVIRRRPR
jgi:small subunit ribosomal protein S1